MSFKLLYKILFSALVFFLFACSNSSEETNLIDLGAIASEDVIAISFPLDSSETTLSINSEFDFTLQGLKSNGVDLVTISGDIAWSLSAGAASTIDQLGHFRASANAELVTVTAKFGILTESIDIRISSAKFDQVIQLDEQAFSIDMCQSQSLKPVGRYVDDSGNEEIRQVDSTIINTIEWIVRNKEDSSDSKRVYIDTINNQAALHTLATGDVLIQAKALSLVSGAEVTSVDFEQTVGNALNAIKLCLSGENLDSCDVTTATTEIDTVLSLIAVGNYQATDGSTFNENITRNSQWGLIDIDNATIAFSTDRQQLEFTGTITGTTDRVSVACGNIEQSLDTIDITEGVILDIPVSCTGIDCQASSALFTINDLNVDSFDVTANGTVISDNVSLNLTTQPSVISLVVIANLSNNTQPDITSDADLTYTIVDIVGQLESDVIVENVNSPGVFTVVGAGTAEITLEFKGSSFTVLIQIP